LFNKNNKDTNQLRKSSHAKIQKETWFRLVNVRMRLQHVMDAINRFPVGSKSLIEFLLIDRKLRNKTYAFNDNNSRVSPIESGLRDIRRKSVNLLLLLANCQTNLIKRYNPLAKYVSLEDENKSKQQEGNEQEEKNSCSSGDEERKKTHYDESSTYEEEKNFMGIN